MCFPLICLHTGTPFDVHPEHRKYAWTVYALLVGGFIALMRITNGREPNHVFGKPSPSLLAPVLRRFKPEQIAVVGDRLYTDKAMADNADIDFVCVLSGETTRESLSAYLGLPPAIVVETLGDLAG